MSKPAVWPALEERVARLRDGTLTVAAFREWFFQMDWEYESPSDAAFEVGLTVENVLYQWEDFPDVMTAAHVACEIDEEIAKQQAA